MEGRNFSGFYRNASEEMFIRTMMEGGIGMQAPNMEMLGFKNLTQNFRTDSEELFKSWLTNGETNGSHQTDTGPRPRQASRRISAELGGLANRTGDMVENKRNDDILLPLPTFAESSNDLNSDMTGVEKATNMFLAKAWFQSSQPMTRSRSSELRRKYVAMQNSQTPMGVEAAHLVSENGVNNIPPVCENQYSTFMSPSNSSSSNFNNQQAGTEDKISSVVSMLKGTLERKKLTNNNNNQVGNNEVVVDSSFEYFNQLGPCVYENLGTYAGVLQAIEESLLEGILGPTISREPSQSESSAAPQVVSNCFDNPCASVQAPTACESSMNQMGDAKDSREHIYENSKDEQKKKGGLIRYRSTTSSGSVDPTKKRRVERSRKMAEAKERSSTPVIPSDMQSILKRCENLEKEVRSLKLNLSFMNRKDSEQTKQIEVLQKHNDELSDEKNRLLEEIERIIAEGQM